MIYKKKKQRVALITCDKLLFIYKTISLLKKKIFYLASVKVLVIDHTCLKSFFCIRCNTGLPTSEVTQVKLRVESPV